MRRLPTSIFLMAAAAALFGCPGADPGGSGSRPALEDGVVVLTADRVLDGRGGVLEGYAVVVREGGIAALLPTAELPSAELPESERRKMAFSFIDVLGDLHAVDPDAVGLGTLGKKENYVGRQLKTWYRSWTSSIESAEYDDPRAHEIREFLLANTPDQGPARVVHGDYGLHNCLIGPDCKVAAVVDWEISTLGDPLADLAYALNPWPDPTDQERVLPEAATAPPGFPSRTELADRYGERTGRDLSQLDFYVAFNRWKTACIVHGVYARYRAGKKSTEGVDLDEMRERVGRSLGQAEEAASRIS